MWHIAEVFGKAWIETTKKPDLAINAFKKTGLVPIDRNVFKDSDFVDLNVMASVPFTINSNATAETERCSQIIQQIQNAVPNISAADASPSPMGVNSPSESNSVQEAISGLKTSLDNLTNRIDRLLIFQEPNYVTPNTSPSGLDRSDIDVDVNNLASLLDVRVDDGALGSPSTSHATVDNSNAPVSSKNLTSRPKNKAFLVTDENYRQKLVEFEKAKALKASKPPRKRKNSEPLGDSTNKRIRQRKKTLPAVNQIQDSRPQIISCINMLPLQQNAPYLRVPAPNVPVPLNTHDDNGVPYANIVVEVPPSSAIAASPSDTVVLDWHDDGNTHASAVVEPQNVFSEIFQAPKPVQKNKRGRKAENCPPAHFCRELMIIAEEKEQEKKLREEEIQLNKGKREKSKVKREKETLINRSFKEKKVTLQKEKKNLLDGIKSLKSIMETSDGKANIKQHKLKLHDLKTQCDDVERRIRLLEMEALQSQIRVKQEDI
ncbi:hypothetical protein QAD02_023706 [Eretmocerus hayati]|uniref:Uncharacterized protein n=1 Tax=Eretmocerus hayati TaxID=131215 RepID=A0ACC2PYS7_9HYME|nr:hypothetical protein QAD02_023706 [Eretmocerus hayati]